MEKNEKKAYRRKIFNDRMREIKDICEGLILIGLGILGLIAALQNAPAWGADWEQTYERDYGALDMADYVGKSLEGYIKFQQREGKRETEVLGRGYLIDNILTNQWIITRSVIHGFTGFQAAIDRIRSDQVTQAILYPTAKILHDMDTDTGWFATGSAGQGVTQAKKELRITDVDLTDERLTRTSAYQAHTNYTRILEQVNQRGFFSGDTIFKKIQAFAVILLGIAVMVRLAFMAFKIFDGGEPPLPVEWFRLFIRLALLLFIMLFSGRMIMFGISMADSVKNMIIEGAFAGQGMDVALDLIDARMDYVDSTMSGNLLQLITGEISNFILNWLSWLAYACASMAIFLLLIVGDIVMALMTVILPLVCVFAIIPGYEDNFPGWIRNYLSLLFYGPLASVYAVLLVAILTIGIDTSPFAFIIIAIAYIVGAWQIPKLAQNLGTGTLAGMAIAIASLPTDIAMTAVKTAATAGVGVLTDGAGVGAIEGGQGRAQGKRRALAGIPHPLGGGQVGAVNQRTSRGGK